MLLYLRLHWQWLLQVLPLMVLTNITGETYISTIITLLTIGLFVVSVTGIRSASKN